MKKSTKILLLILGVIEAGLAVTLFNVLTDVSMLGKMLIMGAVLIISLAADAAVLHSGNASVVSDAKRLKDTDDYIRAFQAWLNEDTPFTEYIKRGLRQLESLKRKQAALRAVLDDSEDSPFLTTAKEVDAYILANSKRVLNRVMIYDQGEPQKFQMHASYLMQVLGENDRVLSDFENLILEVSQIGDNALDAATPCLNELTNALRSVRSSGPDAFMPSEAAESTDSNAGTPMPM